MHSYFVPLPPVNTTTTTAGSDNVSTTGLTLNIPATIARGVITVAAVVTTIVAIIVLLVNCHRGKSSTINKK